VSNLSRRLQKTNKDQFLLTIPKALVDLLDWKDKNEIEFSLENNQVTIKKKGGKK